MGHCVLPGQILRTYMESAGHEPRSFGNAARNFHLARSAYLDGSDLGARSWAVVN